MDMGIVCEPDGSLSSESYGCAGLDTSESEHRAVDERERSGERDGDAGREESKQEKLLLPSFSCTSSSSTCPSGPLPRFHSTKTSAR